jgi:hypothetical protein
MTPSKALLGSLVVLFASPPPLGAETTPQERLAGQFTRAAMALVESPMLALPALEGSLLLAAEAARLDPTADRWRILLRLADLAERRDLRSEAVGQLVRLDRQDEVARLIFINDAMDRYQTAEQRIEKYEWLLTEERRRSLGPAVASRLSADFALLLDRRGDVDEFSRRLADAVALDPSNRSAAATAAGFFRANVEDAYGEAELLTTLVLADPTAPEALVLLAELLLEHGAYVGADRLYRIASRSRVTMRQIPSEGMLADWAVAQWGRADVNGALGTMQRRQRQIDELYRRQLQREDARMTALELARLHGPMTSTLATIRAAIHQRLADDKAAPALAVALAAYDREVEELEQAEISSPTDIAQRHLEAAWVALWLGGEIEYATGHLEAAGALLGDDGMSPEAEARFEGWLAFRQNDLTRAAGLLGPGAGQDPAARLGLALSRREGGQLREAARDLYDLFLDRPGSLMGVWASDLLAEMIGQRVGPTPTAVRLEELVAKIPTVVDRLPDEPTLGVSLRLTPAKTTFEPYEPIIINIEITNNAPMPLAIDDGGPIHPQIAIIPSVEMSRMAGRTDVRPMIVDIDRRLRLQPRERLVVPVDLRRGALAQVLNSMPLRGATLKVTAIIGFRMTGEEVYGPGILGSEIETPAIRVDGIRVTTGWIAGAIEAILVPDSSQDLITIALLSHVVPLMKEVRSQDPLRALEQFGDRQLEDDATAAIAEAYTKLDSTSRAWLLAVMPRLSLPLAPVYQMAQKDKDRHVQLMYLLFCLTGPDDPMIDAAKRGEDPDIRVVAEMMQNRILPARGAQQ